MGSNSHLPSVDEAKASGEGESLDDISGFNVPVALPGSPDNTEGHTGETAEAKVSAKVLIDQLRARQAAHEHEEWDLEDSVFEAEQLTDLSVQLQNRKGSNSSSSSGKSADSGTPQGSGSKDYFYNAFCVPYHAQYRHEVEKKEEEEMQRLLQQLHEEEEDARKQLLEQRQQLLQQQLEVIRKQLGQETTKAPDLEWLLADDPEENKELNEVLAAFRARDDDLKEHASSYDDTPVTCKSLFCRCPCRKGMRSDERA